MNKMIEERLKKRPPVVQKSAPRKVIAPSITPNKFTPPNHIPSRYIQQRYFFGIRSRQWDGLRSTFDDPKWDWGATTQL